MWRVIFVFLDLIELASQTSENIVNQLVNCRAVKQIIFKNIKLIRNFKLININQNEFITSLTSNLTHKLFENERDLTVLKDMIMNTSKLSKRN